MSLSLMTNTRRHGHVLASSSRTRAILAAPRLCRRLASSSTSSNTPANTLSNTGARSVQEVERALAEQREMMSKAARMNPGMDISSQVMPVFETHLDPQKSVWYFLKWWQDKPYKMERRQRGQLTRQALGELIGRGGLDEYKNSAWRWTIPEQVRTLYVGLRRGKFIKKTLRELAERYNEYNRVQASGTIGQANSISRDEAFVLAQNVIRGRKIAETKRGKMSWSLVKENHEPYLVSARITIADPVDMRMAAQLVVRFDTEQALTTQKGNGEPITRQQRVVENIVFEKLVPPKDNRGWLIKKKLDPPKATP